MYKRPIAVRSSNPVSHFRRIIVFLLTAFLVLPGGSAAAITITTSDWDDAVLKDGNIDDDVIAMADRIVIRANVDGNVMVMAGDILLDGSVDGDTLLIGGEIMVEGRIDGDFQAVGGDITLNASVGEDVGILAGAILIGKSGTIEGKAWLAGGEVDMRGHVGSRLKIAAAEVVISGTVDGDLLIHGPDIEITETAIIRGDLKYDGPFEAEIHPDAQIFGDVVYSFSDKSKEMEHKAFAFAGASGLVFALGLALIGAVLALAFPRFTIGSAGLVFSQPLRSLGVGFLLLLFAPGVLLICAITIIGLPIAVVLGMVYAFSILLGYLVTALGLARKFSRSRQGSGEDISGGRRAMLAAGGVLLLFIISLIPFIGTLTNFLAIAAGVGAIYTLGFGRYKNKKQTA